MNVQGSALAKLFRLPETEAEFAATAQQFGVAVVVELIIMMSLIAWEVIGQNGSSAPSIETTQPERSAAIVTAAPALAAAEPLKLVRQESKSSAHDVMRIMTETLEPAPGRSVCLDSSYRRYAAICQSEGLEPLLPEHFLDAMAVFCRSVGLATRAKKGRLHLVNVQLAAPDRAA